MIVTSPGFAETTPVRVAQPEQRPAVATLQLSGSLVAAQRANLSARVDGLVAQLHVDIGDQVKQGDTILTLDSTLEAQFLRERDADVAAMQANLREQQRLVDEAQRLVKEKHLPQNELALREARLDIARAELNAAQAAQAAQADRIRWHALQAPFDGVIHRRLTERGEWVTKGTPVVELVALEPIFLDVQVPQERFLDIAANDPVTLHSDALPGIAIAGQVAVVVPVSDPSSRTFRVRIRAIAPQHRLLPGTSAVAEFNLSSSAKTALIIPRDAVLRNPDGQFSVFTIDRSSEPVARRQLVKLGQQVDTGVEVLQGLTMGDAVVVRGNEILRDGQPVHVLPN